MHVFRRRSRAPSVSSKKQSGDLARQIQFLKDFDTLYSSYTPITDIGSGINFQRKGLNTILQACYDKTVGNVVIAHRDRLSRFAFDLISRNKVAQIITDNGGKIITINSSSTGSSEQELAEDLMTIVHIYSCKQMGKRSYAKKEKKT